MLVFKIVWIVFQIIIGYQLILPFILYFFYAIKKNRTANPISINKEYDYAIIVTAYEQTSLVPNVVNSILKLNYSNYLIYIVADNCNIDNLSFQDNRVILLKPEETLASNVKSHFYAINHFKREHEILTIIDSDNLVQPEYLNELNVYFNKGFKAVQGLRAAKNLNSTFACLDAARDIYYHFYDGKILFELGSSATLAGSGMAFTTQLYRESLGNLSVTGAGFDKVLQAQILKRDIRIAFAENAIVYDEKTSQPEQLVNQRSRWINTWFKYFSYGFTILFSGIRRTSINQLIFGLILLRPPLFLFILVGIGCLFINLFIFPYYSLIWFISFIVFAISFYISLKKSNTDEKIYKSLINIPRFIYFQVVSLFLAKNANKRSVATKHTQDKGLL